MFRIHHGPSNQRVSRCSRQWHVTCDWHVSLYTLLHLPPHSVFQPRLWGSVSSSKHSYLPDSMVYPTSLDSPQEYRNYPQRNNRLPSIADRRIPYRVVADTRRIISGWIPIHLAIRHSWGSNLDRNLHRLRGYQMIRQCWGRQVGWQWLGLPDHFRVQGRRIHPERWVSRPWQQQWRLRQCVAFWRR